MTLKEAVKILNQYSHNFEGVAELEGMEWYAERCYPQPLCAFLIREILEYKRIPGYIGRQVQALTGFEAVAIAEKYQREAVAK